MDVIKLMDRVKRKPDLAACERQRRRPACTSAQSDQHLCYSLLGKYNCKLATLKNPAFYDKKLWIFAFLTTIPLKGCVSCAPTVHCRCFCTIL